MSRRVYFVRHGESESNVNYVVQGLHDLLTPEGERQAERIAGRAKSIDFGALISSDAVRAKMTAEAIAKVTGKEITLSPLLREVRRPSSIIGLSWESQEYKDFLEYESKYLGEPDQRHSDEENYGDMFTRAKDALAFLESQEAEDILVVTHGLFLKVMVARMLFGDEITPTLWRRFVKAVLASNTGLTICICGGERWRLVSWNDHAHFAD